MSGAHGKSCAVPDLDLVAGIERAGRRGGPTVSVVLPCLNEEASVGECVRLALEAGAAAGLSTEVVVVDNGSSDGSAVVAAQAGARVIGECRGGYGNALRAGIVAAGGEVVVIADADCTYQLERIADLVGPVLDGSADLVLGARLHGANRETMPVLHRFVGTPVLTFLVRRAAGGLEVSDSQTGFRAFRRDAALRLGLRGEGMEFASEMLIEAARTGWRVAEIPTRYQARVGKSKLDPLRDGWRHLRLISLLAPDLVLVWPGAAALLAGLLLSLWSLVNPAGLTLGWLRWQPVFFSTIAMVFGAQALLGGSILAFHSSASGHATHQRFAFVGTARFRSRCVSAGVAAALGGLAIDGALFVTWASGSGGSSRTLALASLAQGLLIVGSTTAVFGLVTRLLLSGRRGPLHAGSLGIADLLAQPAGPPPSPDTARSA